MKQSKAKPIYYILYTLNSEHRIIGDVRLYDTLLKALTIKKQCIEQDNTANIVIRAVEVQ